MSMDISLNSKINSKGWIHVKGIFSEKEIYQFREFALNNIPQNADLLLQDGLKEILVDGRMVDLIQQVLGTNECVYFADSVVSIDSTTNGFHKDSAERYNEKSIEWKDSNYSLIRFAIYLQDHTSHSGGICLREKSHHTPDLNVGKIINVKSGVGDVLAWKLTTSHSANALVFKYAPGLSIHPRISRRLPRFIFQPKIKPRIAVFFTVGIKDEHLKNYVAYLKTRKYAVDKWKSTEFLSEDIIKCKSKGIEVLDLSELLKDVDEEKLSVEYVKNG